MDPIKWLQDKLFETESRISSRGKLIKDYEEELEALKKNIDQAEASSKIKIDDIVLNNQFHDSNSWEIRKNKSAYASAVVEVESAKEKIIELETLASTIRSEIERLETNDKV
jgi:chromosome segregation ATPase